MKTIDATNLSSITLGRQGENLAREVVFDLSEWIEKYGPGVAELIYQRPGDTAPYPVAAVREGDTLLWTPTATDTAQESTVSTGSGHCELHWYVGDLLAKSQVWRVWVDEAMDTPSETAPPEPEKGWVDQVVAVGVAAKASADAAKADADLAATIAAEVAANAAKTAQEASVAEQAKEAAQTAQRLAEAAKQAAETAQKAAEEAKAAAAQSATDAATAKSGAEAALKSAQDAAAAASQALADLRTLYQDMQTWATGVVQTVNSAAESAANSADAAGKSATAAELAQGKAEDARRGSEAARDRAEMAAVRQPVPNAETGTWWVWDVVAAAYVDSGEPYEGAALYATFDVDPATGKLSVFTPARYHGPEFALNEATGKLEVTVNG